MNFRIFLITALMMSGMATFALASDRDQILEELYTKSGLEKQIAQLPDLFQAGFSNNLTQDKNFKNIPEKALAQLRQRAAVDFSATEMKKVILSEISEALSDEEIKANLDWLNSPSGMKITAAEETSTTPEGMVAMQEYIQEMQNNPPPESRVALMRELDSATQTTESSIQMVQNTQMAIMSAVNATLPENEQLSFDQITALVEQESAKHAEQIRYSTFLMLFYIYRDINDPEIQEYIDHANSPAGSQFITTSLDGIKQGFFEGGYRLGKSMSEILKEIEKERDA